MFDIESLICVLLFFSFMWVWKTIRDLIKARREQDMFKKAGWIAEQDNRNLCYSNSVRLRDMELISYVLEEQATLKLPPKYCINYSNEYEKKHVEKILNLHKENVITQYFSDFLAKSKDLYKLSSKEYYFYSLYCFIHKELSEYKCAIEQEKIYKYESTDGSYSTYTLTDYGIIYYKLYLITLMFIEKNERTKKLFEYINPKYKFQISEYIDKNKVTFWSY